MAGVTGTREMGDYGTVRTALELTPSPSLYIASILRREFEGRHHARDRYRRSAIVLTGALEGSTTRNALKSDDKAPAGALVTPPTNQPTQFVCLDGRVEIALRFGCAYSASTASPCFPT